MKPDHVPADRILPFVRQYLEEYDNLTGATVLPKQMRAETTHDPYGGSNDRYGNKRRFCYSGAASVLSQEVGMHPDSLYRYLSGRYKWMKFDLADRLFVAMGTVHLWNALEGPLADIYWNTKLYNRDKCENPECSNKPKSIQGVGSRWCSDHCRYMTKKLERVAA